MTDKTIRIVVNGDPVATFEMTRQIAESYLPSPPCPDPECKFGRKSRLPDDWDPNTLTIAHLIGVQMRARISGIPFGKCRYRMKAEAAMQVETAFFAAQLEDGTVGMVFRMVPVVIDESVPWVDFEVMP